MAKQTGSYRQIVSIPADLKQRMDKVADQVNWSALAAQAFEVKLAEFAAKKERKNMQDVIQRLRGLRIAETGEMCKGYKAGQVVGRKWAEDHATPAELEGLDFWKQSLDADGPTTGYSSLAAELYFAMNPERKHDRAAMRAFWEFVGADTEQREDNDFIAGFCEGARDIWYAVKDKI